MAPPLPYYGQRGCCASKNGKLVEVFTIRRDVLLYSPSFSITCRFSAASMISSRAARSSTRSIASASSSVIQGVFKTNLSPKSISDIVPCGKMLTRSTNLLLSMVEI